MTSSLVGSEMCIRDRGNTSSMCGGGWSGGGFGAAYGTAWPAFGPPLLLAVSYTHLTLPTICSV
eukprot:5595760-Prorocentrum_lima.AAC.1